MNSNFFHLFRLIDIFGIPPLFTIRGHQTFQTTIGSVLTLICSLIMIIYVSIFLNQMFAHKKPTILTTVYNDEVPNSINLTNENFYFAFGLQDKEYTNYIDESIYNVSAVQTKVIARNNQTYYYSYPIQIIKCSQFKFKIIPEYFTNLPLNNLYCLNESSYELEGEFKRDFFTYLKLNFSKCNNSTKNNFTCKSNEELNYILTGGFLGIFMIDYTIVPRNYKSPFHPYGKNLYSSFSINFFNDIFLFLKSIEIITDSGYFFEKKNKIKSSVYDYIFPNIDHRISNDFLSLTIRLSSKREVYERSYIKLQTIFSNVGGMLKMILIFGEYSIYFIRIVLYKNYILEFFNMDESEIRLKKVREQLSHMRKYLSSQSKIIVHNSSGVSINNNSFNHINNSYANININNMNNVNKNYNMNKSIISNNNINEDENNNRKINDCEKKERILSHKYLLSPCLTPNCKINNSQRKSFNDFCENISPSTQGKFLQTLNSISKEQKSFFENKRKTMIERKNSVFNEETNFPLRKNSTIKNINSIKKIKQLREISLPKTKVRIIKIPSFWSDFLCKKNTFDTIKQVQNNFKEIQFLLDIVHYLKSENTLNIIMKYFFDEEQRKVLAYTYSFDIDFEFEKKGYEYMIKHKKNAIDNENINTTGIKFNNYLNN